MPVSEREKILTIQTLGWTKGSTPALVKIPKIVIPRIAIDGGKRTRTEPGPDGRILSGFRRRSGERSRSESSTRLPNGHTQPQKTLAQHSREKQERTHGEKEEKIPARIGEKDERIPPQEGVLHYGKRILGPEEHEQKAGGEEYLRDNPERLEQPQGARSHLTAYAPALCTV